MQPSYVSKEIKYDANLIVVKHYYQVLCKNCNSLYMYDTQMKTHVAHVYIPLSLPTTLSLKLLVIYINWLKIVHS